LIATMNTGEALLLKVSRQACAALGLLFLAGSVAAQSPLSIEQLIVDSARLQLSTAVDFRSVLGPAGERRDSLVTTALRYGVAPGLEVNGAVGVETRDWGSQSTARQTVSLGANWQLAHEGRLPALVLEGRLDAWSTGEGARGAFPGGALAATAYRSIDPVVLSLSALYRVSRSFTTDQGTVAPGGTLRLEPAINFAVNPQVTLFGGIALVANEATRVDGREIFQPGRDVRLRGGFGWSPRDRSTFFVSGELASSELAGGFNVQWLYQF
jgi:hypothetical protein